MILSHPYLQRVAEAHAAPLMAAQADRLGMTVPQYAQTVSEHVRHTLEGVPVTIRMTTDRLAAFLRVGVLPVVHDFQPQPHSKRALNEALAFRQTFPAGVMYGRWGGVRPGGVEGFLFGKCGVEVRHGDRLGVTLWEGDTCGAAPYAWDGVPSERWTLVQVPQILQVLHDWKRDPAAAARQLEARGTWNAPQVASLSTSPSPLSLHWKPGRCPLDYFTRQWVEEHPVYVEAHFMARVRRGDMVRVHFDRPDDLEAFRPRLDALNVPSHLITPEVPA